MSGPRILTGTPYPLGATPDEHGTGFSVFSRTAERVELCLFDEAGTETRVDLPRMTGHSWHGYLPGVGPGQRYGYRVHGPWAPDSGVRCNPSKLLLDPYARAIDGHIRWGASIHGHVRGYPYRMSQTDSAPDVPRSVVVDSRFDWGDDQRPGIPDNEMVIYETHVKGFSRRHPGVPEELRGTFAGLAHPAALEHLTSLGVTSVELMPVHQHLDDGFLLDRGLSNYWGYSSIGYLAPHAGPTARSRNLRRGQVLEFKAHGQAPSTRRGIEVILDVVYNHTAEGNDRRSHPRLPGHRQRRLLPPRRPPTPRRYVDYTGTGNSARTCVDPHVLQLIMDSLRYWVLRDARRRLPLRPRFATLARELARLVDFGCRPSSTSSTRTPLLQLR